MKFLGVPSRSRMGVRVYLVFFMCIWRVDYVYCISCNGLGGFTDRGGDVKHVSTIQEVPWWDGLSRVSRRVLVHIHCTSSSGMIMLRFEANYGRARDISLITHWHQFCVFSSSKRARETFARFREGHVRASIAHEKAIFREVGGARGPEILFFKGCR